MGMKGLLRGMIYDNLKNIEHKCNLGRKKGSRPLKFNSNDERLLSLLVKSKTQKKRGYSEDHNKLPKEIWMQVFIDK